VLAAALIGVAFVATSFSTNAAATQATVKTSTRPDGFVPQSVSFVSSTTGYAWGHFRSPRETGYPPRGMLARTTDYGATWERVATPSLVYSDTAQSGIIGVTFVNSRVGYLYGRALWATHDGGKHWSRRQIPDPIDNVAAGGGVAWALVDHCRSPNGCLPEHQTLVRLADDGARLAPSGLHHKLGYLSDIDDVQGGDVIVTSDKTTLRNPLWLHRPGDGWVLRRTPCRYAAAAALLTSRTIALVCGGLPGAGSQLTAAWRSDDAGRHWVRVGNPGGSGYMSSLAVSYPDTWMLSRVRGGIETSFDGGRHWSYPAFDPERDLTEGQGWLWVGFTTPYQAVAVTADDQAPYAATSVDGGQQWQLHKVSLPL
jgi:hypothetical protein